MVTNKITITNARLIFKNFAGKESRYNKDGARNFGVLIDEDLAEKLSEDGWNVKRLKPRPNSEDPEYMQPYLTVKISYKKWDPIVVLITKKGKIKITEETIDQLDWTQMENVDMIINPYNYPASNGHPAGVAAYLKSIYVTVKEDELEDKYSNIPWLDGEDEPVRGELVEEDCTEE